MKPRWIRLFQFRLRTMLLGVAALSWPLAILGNALQEYRAELAVLTEMPKDVQVNRIRVAKSLKAQILTGLL